MKIGQIFSKNMRTKKAISGLILIGGAALAVSGLLIAAAPKPAQPERPANVVGFYTKNGQTIWIVPGGDIDVTIGKYTPSQLEALHPMAAVDEAKIVHSIPAESVIIDGVTYKPEDISVFNGKRLHFITGSDGNLYAFTTTEGLEEFIQKDLVKPQTIESNATATDSIFYTDVWYAGESVGLQPGTGLADLSPVGFDNAISSVKASPASSFTFLYDLPNYLGDSFAMQGGSNHSMLLFEGWNDRASSIYVSFF
jgi:hypothetical protein